MTIAVSSIMSRASTLLLDETGIRWPTSELVDWVQDGLLEIALIKPTTFTEKRTLPLSAGIAQEIPADTRHLHRIISNTNGPVIRSVALDVLDRQDPSWPMAKTQKVAKYLLFNELEPKRFFCYPPNDGTGSIEAICAVNPPEIAADSTIEIDTPYRNPLVSYVLYRAFSKDSEAGDLSKADRHYQMFGKQLGLSVMGDAHTKES